MKSKIGLGIIFTFSILVFSQMSFAVRCDALKPGQAAFFEHSKYSGACVVRTLGRYANAKSIGIGNDKISSIKVGSRTQVRLCKDNNFRGGCKTYTRSMSSLGKMNDKTSSAIIGKTTSTTTASVSCRPRANQVVFFQHAKYQGACSVRNMGRYANAKAIGIGNDKISSIKLGSGSHVVLCKDNNFRGGCKTYTKSMSSLGKMNDKTSSAIIVKTVPQKASPYVPKKNNTSSSGNTAYQCDAYGICTCKGKSACLSMIAANNLCAANKNNEPVSVCDEVGCACYKSGSSAAIANADDLCNLQDVIGMNIVGKNKFVLNLSCDRLNKMKFSDTIIGAEAVYQENPEEEVPTDVVSPQTSPPYVFEKNKTPLTKTAPLRNRGKSELPAPSSLSVDKVTSTTVTLSWFDNSDREYGVEVYRMDPVEARRNRSTNWKFLGLFEERIDDNVKGTGWRSDEDYDLNPDTNYCYKLRAYVGFDRSVVSDYSKLVCTKTSASNE